MTKITCVNFIITWKIAKTIRIEIKSTSKPTIRIRPLSREENYIKFQ